MCSPMGPPKPSKPHQIRKEYYPPKPRAEGSSPSAPATRHRKSGVFSFSLLKHNRTRGTRSVSGFEPDRRRWRIKGRRNGVAVKVSVPLQGTKKLWAPQEGHVVVRALLPLPQDIAKAVSFLFTHQILQAIHRSVPP